MRSWQLQDAKRQFSQVVKDAEAGDVQVVTRHGREVAVVLSYARYLELSGGGGSLLASFAGAPDLSRLDLARDRTAVRAAPFE